MASMDEVVVELKTPGPEQVTEQRDRLDAIRELRTFGKGRTLNGIKIRTLIEEGRRL